MKTQFSKQYSAFRELLQNDELQMFQQTLKILAHMGIKENKLVEVRSPEVSPTISVYIYRQGQVLSLLGGHWIRKGEPTKDFMKEMDGYISDLKQGRGLQ